MHHASRPERGRASALAPAAILLLALCLLAGGAQAADTPRFVVGDVLESGTGTLTTRYIVTHVDTAILPTPYYTLYAVEQNAGQWQIPRFWHQDDRVDEQNLVESWGARRVDHVDPVNVVITDTTITGGDQFYTGLSLWEVGNGAVYWIEDSGNSPIWLEGDLSNGSLIGGAEIENQPEPLYAVFGDVTHRGDRWYIEKYWHGSDTFPESDLWNLGFRRTAHADPHFIVVNDTTLTGGDIGYYGRTLAEVMTIGGYWVENWEERPDPTMRRYDLGDVLGNETSPDRYIVTNATEGGVEQPRYTLFPVVPDSDGWRITRYPADPFVLDAVEVWERAMHRMDHTDPHFAVVDDPSVTGGITYHGLSLGEILEGTPGYPVGPIGGDTGYFLVSTTPSGAEVYLEDTSGTRTLQGTTSAGPLNVTVYLTGTPIRKVVATLPGYHDAVYNVTQYPPKDGTLPVALTLERAGGTPYKPHTVPGRIEGEDYDLGGEGVAYHDTTPGNSGGAYRSDDVDIERTAGLVTPNVGWIRDGEFLTYTVNVTQAGSYLMTVRVASPNSGRTFVLRVDGQEKGVVPVPKTGSFATFVTAPVQAPVTLSAGTHTLKLEFHGDGQNLDWIELTPVSPPTTVPTTTVPTTPTPGGTPYPSAHAVPGRVESEDYDVGGFSDTTPANEGGAYRQDAVDIERGGSGYNVGWIRPGEYLEYSVDTTGADNFQVYFRVANPGPARTMTVRVNGEAKTLTIPSTGGFQNWQTVLLFAGWLNDGRNLVRIETGTAGSFNLDYMEFDRGCTPPPTTVITTPTPTTPPSGGASFVAAPTTAPKGAAVKFTVTPAAGKSIKAAWWSFDATGHLATWNSRNVNPTFFYPAKGTFSPLVKLTYTDGSTETVQRANYIRAT